MAVCSKVPEIFEAKPFCISCSMRPLTLRKLNRLSRRHDVQRHWLKSDWPEVCWIVIATIL